MIDINAELHQWFTNFFIKRLQTVHPKIHTNNKIKQNQRLLDLATQKLAEELQESIIKKFKKRKVYAAFKDNIWVLI